MFSRSIENLRRFFTWSGGGRDDPSPISKRIIAMSYSAKRSARPDFAEIPVIEVARALLGEESRERSTATEKHFAGNDGLFVNVQKNRWYCHGNKTGGDA